MKQIILGDIHGRTVWKDIVAKHPEADRFIFIGDYVDTHEDILPVEQLNNLEAIIDFKKNTEKEVILLIGNHDHHYWPGVGNTGTSGYQPKMAQSFEYVFNANKELFQIAFEDEYETLYSHAGITWTFLKMLVDAKELKEGQLEVVNFLNDIFKAQPNWFTFNQKDYSGYGDHICQSCIWVRPKSLYEDKLDALQVIGHTSVGQINHPPKSERMEFYLIDCLPKQYLSCTDGVFKIETMQ